MNVTTILASDWYQNLMQLIPDGKLFSLRSVFDGIPRIVQQLPTTIMLTIGGALFGLVLALLFAIVKINRVKILYPLQAFFVSFLKGTPILVQLMLTYYGIPLALKALNQQWGTGFNINAIPAAFAIVAFAFNEAAYASETIRATILSVNPGEIEAKTQSGDDPSTSLSSRDYSKCAVVATPTLINSLIGLTKGTSLAFSAGVVEVFAQAQILGGADYRYFERFISVALVYWVVNIGIESLGRFIERKMAISAPDTVQTDVKGDLR